MRAIVFNKRVRVVKDYPRPKPGLGEALVRVTVSGVCSTDIEITRGYMGFVGVLGHEFTGVVERSPVRPLEGKRVVGEINIGCGRCAFCRAGRGNHCPNRRVLGILRKDGSFADYLTLPVKNLHILPDTITDEEAVFTEPLAAAFAILRQVDINKNTKAAVLGDGRLGLLTAMVLNLTGCSLTVFGRHRAKLSILKGLGIRTVLDGRGFKREFDAVVDATGSPDGLSTAFGLVRPEGTVVLKTTVAKRGVEDLNSVVIDEVKVVGSRCGPFPPAIDALARKKVDVGPLISEVFNIEEGVEAIEYARRRGVLNVLIRM